MPQPEEMSDPTDWNELPLHDMSEVDASLHCQICKEFFKTPMMTECTHTFCSLCIRRCLNEDGKCPSCRTEGTVSKLRKNALVEEIVNAFKLVRPVALQLARDSKLSLVTNQKRKADPSDTTLENISHRQTRSRNQRSATSSILEEQEANSNFSSNLSESLKSGFSRCPICSQAMKIELVYSHLDTHNETNRPQFNSITNSFGNIGSAQPREHTSLPSINYAILNEKDLRKKLISLGIPATGSKFTMQRRHTEFLNMWNANCDSSTPKSKGKVLQDLVKWEQSQGSSSNSSVMDKNFDAKAWASEHVGGFQDLIAQARLNVTKVSNSPRHDAGNPVTSREQKDHSVAAPSSMPD